MSDKKMLSVVERWFGELWSQGDLEAADEIVDLLYAPDWVQIEAKGPEQIKHEVRYMRSVFSDLTYEMVDATVQDNKVWVRYRGTGTHTGTAWGFEPSGNSVTFEGATIFTISREFKIVDRWSAFCFYDIFSDLGLVPPYWELSERLTA